MNKRPSLGEAVASLKRGQDCSHPALAFGAADQIRRKGILVRVDPDTHRRLMIIAAQRSTKLQTLLVAAIDQILAEGSSD